MELDSHSLDVTGKGESRECSCECGYRTFNRSNFRRHKNRHLLRVVVSPSKQQQTLASSTATSSESKTSSTPTIAEDGTLMCESCGKGFRSKYGLKLHVNTKHKETFKHKCSLCGMGFNQTIQFRFHCAKHGKVGLETCPTCKREFFSPGSLRRHMQTCPDSGECSIQCDQCPASFKNKTNLKQHVDGLHGNPKYKCLHCWKTFAWKSSLKAHLKTHGIK